MLDFGAIFGGCLRSIERTSGEVNRAMAPVDGGAAAHASVVVARRVPSAGDVSILQLRSGDQTFEGTIGELGRAEWSASEVVGEDIGIPVETSSIIAGYRAYVDNQGVLTATVFAEVVDDGTGYAVGPSVDDLAEGLGGSVHDVLVMSSVATNDKFELGAYVYDGPSDTAEIYLDGLYSGLAAGDVVIVEVGDATVAARVESTTVDSRDVQEDVAVPVTLVTVGPASTLGEQSDDAAIRVWFDARKAGTIGPIPTLTVAASDILNTPRPVTLGAGSSLPTADTYILVQDAEGTAVLAQGGGAKLSGAPHITITKILDPTFSAELVKPITFIWGLTTVTRGETVDREIIGSGDAMQAWQSLELARSPLTYIAGPDGRTPQLRVYVNGLKWARAGSFFGATPADEIYVIRHDADHQTYVQFGDGELGKRLPTGTNNVVATYRFGVGGNVETNTIDKLVRPVAGVTSVSNPVAASGGEDPPTGAEARVRATQSMRVLGRLVALADFEVEAARFGGVLQAKARWAWDSAGEDALVKIWIVCEGPGDPSADLRAYLQNLAEPGARVEVAKALPWYQYLNFDLELDPNYIADDVRAAVQARLYDEVNGLLALRNAVIGAVFHRSELYAAIHEVAGVVAVRGVAAQFSTMSKAMSVPEGYYLAFTNSPPV